MKIIMNKILTFFVLLLCVFAFTSCDSAVSESGEALVRFGEADGTSRGISADDLEGYTVDNLYWAYVAVKKDGLHTVGESEVTTTAASTDYSKIVTVDGKNYILRPVRPDYEPGLNADVGPFSYGDWLFKLYGFKSCNGTEFTDLVYTGDTVGYTAITKSTTAISVGFNLSPATAFPTTGTLVFGSLYYTVPSDMKFYAGTTFTVTFKDATNGDKVVATATGTITTDCETGTEIPLSITYGAAASFDSGVQGQFNTPSPSYQAEHKFKVEIVYQSGVTSGTGHLQEPVTLSSSTRTFPVLFTAGNLTVLYGDIDDVVVDNGKSEVDNFGPVCRIGTKYYTNLTEAVADYSTTPIEVIRNIDYGGSFSKDFKICPIASIIDGSVVGNNRCYVKNITMAAGKKVDFVASVGDTNGISYTGNGTLNFFSWGSGTCFVDTTGGTLTVNSSGTNLYHTGTCANVTVTNAKKEKTNGLGYHCWGKVTGTLSAANGYVELGASANVTTLTTTSNSVVLTGKPTTVVGNMSTIYEGTTLTYKTPYKAVKFNGNGGKSGSATSLTKYGIEGMYLYKVLGGGVFINSDYCVNPVKNMCWGSSDKGADPVYWSDTIVTPHANTKYLVGSAAAQNLYAVWDAVLCPLGGYVFAFASGGVPCADLITGGDEGKVEVNGVIYQFFNSSGVAVDVKGKTYQIVEETFGKNEFDSSITIPLYNATATGGSYTLLTALKNGGAMYYKIIGKPVSGYKDGVYVCPKDGYANGSSFNSGVYWGASSTSTGHNLITAEPAFGQGKVMSKTIVSAYTDIYKYDTSNSTIWSYLDWLNDGGKSSTSGTPWGAYTDTTMPSAKKEARTCHDWFIPVAVEVGAMHKSGVLPSEWFKEFAITSGGSRIDRRHIMTCCERSGGYGVMLDCYVWEKLPGSYIRNGAVARTSCGDTSATSGSVANTIYCRSF